MVILTLLMTVVLVGLGVAGYMMMKKMQDGYERVIQNVQNQPQYAQQQSNIPVQPMDPAMYGQQQFQMPQQQFNPYPVTSSRVGGRSRRVISVDLVKPCLPGDLLSVP
jgi:flagellar basal body-associated protein FliL